MALVKQDNSTCQEAVALVDMVESGVQDGRAAAHQQHTNRQRQMVGAESRGNMSAAASVEARWQEDNPPAEDVPQSLLLHRVQLAGVSHMRFKCAARLGSMPAAAPMLAAACRAGSLDAGLCSGSQAARDWQDLACWREVQ